MQIKQKWSEFKEKREADLSDLSEKNHANITASAIR